MLGDDGSVGSDDDGPSEFSLEVVDDLVANLLVGGERSERNSNENVLGLDAIGTLISDLLSSVHDDGLGVLLEVGVRLLEVLEGLGAFFLEFGDLGIAGLLDLLSVEHLVCASTVEVSIK